MADMTYAVHTGTCTYLLDDEGICLWTLSPGGNAAAGTDRCVGAQFVACLDMSAPGGLVGELRLGAAALFVRREHGKLVLLRTTSIERVEHRPRTEDEARAHRAALSSQDATAVLSDEIAWSLRTAEDPHTPEPATPLRAPQPPHAPETVPLPAQAQLWALQQAQAAVSRAAPPALAQQPPDPWDAPLAALQPPQPWVAPPLHLAYELPDSAELLDAEDMMSISVTEVTLTMPLYRRPPDAGPSTPPPHAPPIRLAPPAYALPPPAAPPRRASSVPPPPDPPAGPPTPRGPPPARRGVVGPGRRLR